MAIDCSWLANLVKPINRLLNKNGQAYGLTVLAPIVNGHAGTLRQYLTSLSLAQSASGEDLNSPFAKIPVIHNVRFNIIDDLPYVGMPAEYDHLLNQYLVFSCNLDTGNTNKYSVNADLLTFLRLMFNTIPNEIKDIWGHCSGFPEAMTFDSFAEFMQAHQINGGFFFADYPENTLQDVLRSLFEQKHFIDFVIDNQTNAASNPAQLKENFYTFYNQLRDAPTPPPGSII